MRSNISITIIDDNISINDPLIIKLKQLYDNVSIFSSPEDGLNFLNINLIIKNIILLDLKFESEPIDGHEILKRIREMSHLIPVIIWSAVNENNEKFSDLINNRSFYFIKQSADVNDIVAVVKKAEDFINTSIDGALQEWIRLQDKKRLDEPYLITAYGKQYSLNQLLEEIRKQTEFGKNFEKDLIMLTIDLLLRKKKDLKCSK